MSNTNTQRTRLEWFAMFPEPYKTQAIENYEKDYDGFNGQSLFYDAADALFHGFDWDKNLQNQGFDYWAKFQDKLWRNEITLTAPVEEVEATPDYEAIVKESERLNHYRINAEEDYVTTPISVLRYITELESALSFIKSKTESK
jgi:hypothetical protein